MQDTNTIFWDLAAAMPLRKRLEGLYQGELLPELALKDSPVLADYIRHSHACVRYLEKIAKGQLK